MEKLFQLSNDISSILSQHSSTYLTGMRNTLLLAVISTLIGCIIGFICGILQTIPFTKNDSPLKRIFLKFIRLLIRIYVEVFRGTPMILQAVFIFFGLPYFTDGAISFQNIWTVSIIVVSINTGAYMAETVRGGILSIDPGQTEGAKAIGMNHFQTMTNVILPQALRNIMPQIGNNFIINVKDTSVMFIISFPDFFSVHKGVVGSTYKYFPSATIEMFGYLTMTLAASFILRYIEKKMEGDDSYSLVVKDSITSTVGTYNYPGNIKEHDQKLGESIINRKILEDTHEESPDRASESEKGR